jgi:hypothetical protein
MISHALHLSIFEQPAYIDFFNALLEHFSLFCSHSAHPCMVSLSTHARKNALRQAQGERTEFYCLSKTIAYDDGSSRRQLEHAVFFASALSGRKQATRYAGGC